MFAKQMFVIQIFEPILCRYSEKYLSRYSDIHANISKIFLRQEAFERMESSIARLNVMVIKTIILSVMIIFVMMIIYGHDLKRHSFIRLGLNGESCVLRLLCEVNISSILFYIFCSIGSYLHLLQTLQDFFVTFFCDQAKLGGSVSVKNSFLYINGRQNLRTSNTGEC